MKNKKILAAAMAAAVAFSVLLVPQFGSVKAANTNLIKNGNFESEDLTGYLPAKTGNHNVKVVNEAQDGHSVELDGYAAYLFGRGENGGTDSGFLTTEKTTLAAGSYVWTFDVDLISGTAVDEFIYGVYTGLAYGNRGYGSGSSIGKSEQSVNNYEGHAIKGTAGSSSKSVVTVTFNLAEETGVYFSFGFSSKTVNTVAYVDNLKLAKVNVQDTGLVNGDFESGDLTGYLSATTGTHNVSVVDTPAEEHKDVTLNSKAAYLSGRGAGGTDSGFLTTEKITLPAGSYVWTFDVDLISKDNVDEFIYGVYTGLRHGNRGYGSGSSIGCSANTVKTDDRFTVVGTASSTVHKKLSVAFNLKEETGVYLSFGFNNATVNTVAYVDNLKLSNASVSDSITVKDGSFTPVEKDGYFVPYGSVVDGNDKKLAKNADGSFNVSDSEAINLTYFKTPAADGITTFGVSKKEKTGEGNTPEEKAGIQFGSYTENAKDEEFYTLIIRGADEKTVNKLTYGQKNDMVNKYLTWIEGKEDKDKWGIYKSTLSEDTYVIKVVKQQNYMWKNSDGSKLQYAVRLYGDYDNSNADINFSAIGFSMSGNTVGFADSFKTASYSSFN